MDKRSVKKIIAGGLIAFMRNRRHWSCEVGPGEPVEESRTRIILRLVSDEVGIPDKALLGCIRGCWPLEMLGSYTDDELISIAAAAAAEMIMSQLDDELVAAEAKKAPAEARKALAEAKKADDEVEIAVETTRLQLDELVTVEAEKAVTHDVGYRDIQETKRLVPAFCSGTTVALGLAYGVLSSSSALAVVGLDPTLLHFALATGAVVAISTIGSAALSQIGDVVARFTYNCFHTEPNDKSHAA